MMRYALYARTSSDRQELQETIQTQLEVVRRYAQQNRIKIDTRYLDDGVTSHIPFERRVEGSRLLKDAQAGRISHLIVSDFTRLGRTALDVLKICDQLESLGIQIISIREPMPLGAEQSIGTLLRTVLSGFAQYGRDTIRHNAIAGHERAAREGRWNGGSPPFGYRVENHRLVIDEDQAAIVQLIFEKYAEPNYSLSKVASHLNAHNIVTPRAWINRQRTAPRWRTSSVYKILQNTTYVGVSVWRKHSNQRDSNGKVSHNRNSSEVSIKITVPAIVSEEIFNITATKLQQGVLGSPRNTKHRIYILRGLIMCGRCGLAYVGGTTRNSIPYYRCGSQYNGDGTCRNSYVRADTAEEKVWRECIERLSHPEREEAEMLDRLKRQRAGHTLTEQRIESLSKEIAKKTGERARVIGLVRRGSISEDEAARELDQLQQEVEILELEHRGLIASLTQLQEAANKVDVVKDLFIRLRNEADVAQEPQQRRVIICHLIRRIIVSPLKEKKSYELIYESAL